MNKLYACIDGRATTTAVIDAATWSARKLAVSLELLHVLESPPLPPLLSDYSGTIGLDAQEALLKELSALDAQRNQLAQEAGRQLLANASTRAIAAGVTQLNTHLRHGDLIDAVLEVEPDVRLFVLGENYHPSKPGKMHLDHHVERVIRTVKCPVLVATSQQFEVPQRVVMAFDGSPTSHKMVETVARSPLLVGLPVLLAMAGTDAPQARQQLAAAAQVLQAEGFSATTELLPGNPEQSLPPLLKGQGAALLVMGAYGHSRIRQFIVGSTTTTLLRLSEVPVLILR